MLFGEFERSLDEKGRLVLPPAFRREFADRAYVTATPKRPSVSIVSEESMREMARRLQEQVRSGELSPDEQRIWGASVQEVNIDSQGRVAIPQRLREHASIERSAALIGAIDRAELWEPAAWNDLQSSSDDRLSEGYWQ